jgi:hypothetical protein
MQLGSSARLNAVHLIGVRHSSVLRGWRGSDHAWPPDHMTLRISTVKPMRGAFEPVSVLCCKSAV